MYNMYRSIIHCLNNFYISNIVFFILISLFPKPQVGAMWSYNMDRRALIASTWSDTGCGTSGCRGSSCT
jgi:hypothetical protein